MKAADLLTYQQLSRLTSDIPDPYVPRDDENEYERWKKYVAQAGVGEVGMEDYIDSNAAAELVDLGIISAESEDADDVLGPGIKP